MNAPARSPPVVRTACPYCGVGCGVQVRPDGHGGAVVTGDQDHPANFGKLCSKGFALGETLTLDGRLLYPQMRRSDGSYARVDWDTALGMVADGMRRIVERDGPNAVAFYLSGQLLTEDYYVANKLMKGFIGSANVDTNSRLCMASTVAGQRRAFGGDAMPGSYDDLDDADVLVLIGSNAAWCHPVLYQRMIRNRRERGAKLVVIDPRRTASAIEADLFLGLAPGSDAALFSGLLVYLADSGALDRVFINAHTGGFAEALARAREIAPTIAAAATATGLDEADVARFFQLFRANERVVTCYSQGVNQSAQGTDKVGAIINCHLATGRIGRPGMGPFSLTGQPNAMGGREVGGLANQLAAHMGFGADDVDRVRRFWNAPRMAETEGLKAVDMFAAIGRGEIKALWVMATNPAMSLPKASAVRGALGKLELFVVSENVIANDTVGASPHFLLPAAAWGEKDGTVTNSERRISRQRAFLPLPGEARPDWAIVADVGRRLGFADAFSYATAADVFREHAALSAFENYATRAFDIGALATITNEAYSALEPVQWPLRAPDRAPVARLFGDGDFVTVDRKARFATIAPPALREATSPDYPLRLNTGRLRDQWHSMTRTGLSPTLGAHRPEPRVEVHPDDAEKFGLADGGFARVRTQHGACVLKVALDDGQQRGSLFVPIHWSDATASSARVGDLVAPWTDPVSGQPEAKATPAAIERVDFAYGGIALSRAPLALPAGTWWAKVALDEAGAVVFASSEGPEDWRARAHDLFGDAVLTEYTDLRRGIYRVAAFTDGRLDGALYLAPSATPPAWTALREVSPGRGIAASGPAVCACFGVGPDAIATAFASGAAVSSEEIGRMLRAGTRCGSCLPEIQAIGATSGCAGAADAAGRVAIAAE
jgi:assimilatory nitrate reductase catalytic subunit